MDLKEIRKGSPYQLFYMHSLFSWMVHSVCLLKIWLDWIRSEALDCNAEAGFVGWILPTWMVRLSSGEPDVARIVTQRHAVLERDE